MRSMPTALWLVTLCALAFAGCGDPATDGGGATAEAGGAESPEALVKKARDLAEQEDFGGIVRLMVPAERPLMSFGMMMFAKMAPMFVGGLSELGGEMGGEEAKDAMKKQMADFEAAMNAVLEKHGLADMDMSKPPAALQGEDPMAIARWLDEQAPDLDHAAFVAEMIQAFASLGEETAGKATNKFKELGGELKDLQIDGDTATGTIGEDEMTFKKVDGRWYLSVASQMGAGK